VGTPENSELIASLDLGGRLGRLGEEGFLIERTTVNTIDAVVVAANSDIGVLYGVFALLRKLQTHQPLEGLSTESAPRVELRW
jgi:alpha-glucuronidase